MRIITYIPMVCFFLLGAGSVFAHIDHRIEFGFSAIFEDGLLPQYKDIEKFESESGVAIETINWNLGFNGDNKELPNIPLKRMQEYKSRDITLMLTWEPWGNALDRKGRHRNPLRSINKGYVDDYIRKTARDLRTFERPIRLRFGHDMIHDDHPDTQGWFSWQDRAEEYKAAFRRVHDIFIEENALNVEFVWAPNYRPALFEVLKRYYPGPEYVDWIGINGYNWKGESFDEMFKMPYKTIVEHPEFFGNKPIMIAEFAAGADDALVGFDKAQWITDAFLIIPEKYPLVKAVYWLHVKKDRDWRLDSSRESWLAFIEGVRHWRD